MYASGTSLLCFFLNHGNALAQLTPAQTPPPIPPGTIEPIRPSLPPLPNTRPAPTPLPRLNSPQPVPAQPKPSLGVQVKIKRIEVLGNTVFSPAKLQASVASFIGKEATFEDLLAIRTAITDLYTHNGYTTSGAFLPPQDVTSGIVKIQLVEGALERIEIHGLRRLKKNYVRSRITLAAQPPVNLRRLQEALQLLQLDPLFSSVQVELTAGTAPGLSVLTLNLKEAPPITSTLLAENRNPPSVGEIGGTVAVSDKDLLGLGDRLSTDFGLSAGLNSYTLDYDIPLNARDGTLSLHYDNNNSRIVEQFLAQYHIKGRTQTYSLGFRQPISRTPQSEFALSLSADVHQSQTFFMGNPYSFSEGPQNGRSRVRAIRFSQNWVQRRPKQVLAARSQFSLGLGVLGATVNHTGPDGRFFSWEGQFQLVQAFGPDTLLIARVGAQLTPDSLLPLEQFSIGGIDTVRGYRQNQRVGDNGLVGSLEVALPIVRDRKGIGVIQLAPFFDVGTIWNHTGVIPSSSTLLSTGLGLRWQVNPYLSGRLDWGIPLNPIRKQGNSLQDNGIYFSIQFQPF